MPSLPKCDRCKIIIKDSPIKKILKNDLTVDSLVGDGVFITAKLCKDCAHDLDGVEVVSDLPAGDIQRYRYHGLWFE